MDTMMIDVLAPDAQETCTLTVTAYSVHADGRLVVALEDASERTFEVEEWMDVRLTRAERPRPPTPGRGHATVRSIWSSDRAPGLVPDRFGPPGSGKTSLAMALAQEMALPLLTKDLIKETLMSVLVVPDVDTSKLIGQAAIEVMYVVAGASSIGAILEANFHRSASVAGIQGLPGSVVELFCRCDRDTALARYRERSERRQPGHFDSQRTDDELWNDEVTAPVAGGWAVLEIDTTRPVNISAVVLDIRRALGSR